MAKFDSKMKDGVEGEDSKLEVDGKERGVEGQDVGATNVGVLGREEESTGV